MPLINLANHGLGEGPDEYAVRAQLNVDIVGRGKVAYSCDKNFSRYRERVAARSALSTGRTVSNRPVQLLSLLRASPLMPLKHSAAIVRVILEDAKPAAEWRVDLPDMPDRVHQLRNLWPRPTRRLRHSRANAASYRPCR